MDIEPFPKALFDKAKQLGIATVELQFSGGNDEGHLNVFSRIENKQTLAEDQNKFDEEVNEWAEFAYNYSGAGDGNDYGDNITYNFEDGTVTSNEWTMIREYSDDTTEKLIVAYEI